MLIGIMSDSHDKHETVRQVVALFDRLGVKHIIHCGDVGGQAVFDELVGRPVTFVWGNMDHQQRELSPYLEGAGISAPTATPTLITLDEKRFAIYHGHERGFDQAPFSLDVDYILHGHTHVARDESINGIRIINPGALFRARPKSAATLNTTTGELSYYEIA